MSHVRRQFEEPSVLRRDLGHGLNSVSSLFEADLGPFAGIVAKFDRGEKIYSHWHDWSQLVLARDGVLSVITEAGFWVVPPNRAIWIPPWTKHSFEIRTDLEIQTVFFDPDAIVLPLEQCCVLQASPLLRELIGRMMEYPIDNPPDSPQMRLFHVVRDEIRISRITPLHVPQPTQPKLRAIAEQIISNPADNRTLAEWGQQLGASERTLARLFRQNTGMNFALWRQQVRLVKALQMLADSKSVTQIALELGYESPSAFISMFRRSLGTTPSRYFS